MGDVIIFLLESFIALAVFVSICVVIIGTISVLCIGLIWFVKEFFDQRKRG